MLLDGKLVKKEVLLELKKKVQLLDKKLGMAAIQVGNDEASNIYLNQKRKMCEYLDYNFKHIKLDQDASFDMVKNTIIDLNNDDSIDGIILQLPIPKHLDSEELINFIDPLKDIDGLTDINCCNLIKNRDGLYPCTPLGVVDILKYYNIDVEGKNVVIIGRSLLVGKPLFNLLNNMNATVTLCHSKTKDLKSITKNADILISAVGKRGIVTSDMIKDQACVIDVGITRFEGKIYGDVNFDDVVTKAKYITPVPGGVGPMTVSELGKNVYKAYTLRRNK